MAENDLDFAEWVDGLMSRVVAIALVFGGSAWVLAGAKVSTFPIYGLLCLVLIAFFVWWPVGLWLIDKGLSLVGERERPPSRWWVREIAAWTFLVGMALWSAALTYFGILLKEALVK